MMSLRDEGLSFKEIIKLDAFKIDFISNPVLDRCKKNKYECEEENKLHKKRNTSMIESVKEALDIGKSGIVISGVGHFGILRRENGVGVDAGGEENFKIIVSEIPHSVILFPEQAIETKIWKNFSRPPVSHGVVEEIEVEKEL